MKVSKLCVIFGEIDGTGGRGPHRGPPPAESAFPIYRSRGPRRGRRARAARNRRSNGDRVRVGFKISKITNTRFKRDSAVDSAPGELTARQAPTAERSGAAATRGAVPRRGPPPRVRPSARAVYQTPSSLVMSAPTVLCWRTVDTLSRIFRTVDLTRCDFTRAMRGRPHAFLRLL